MKLTVRIQVLRIFLILFAGALISCSTLRPPAAAHLHLRGELIVENPTGQSGTMSISGEIPFSFSGAGTWARGSAPSTLTSTGKITATKPGGTLEIGWTEGLITGTTRGPNSGQATVQLRGTGTCSHWSGRGWLTTNNGRFDQSGRVELDLTIYPKR